ncbi:hypothetical protein [Bowmanella sp. JS7-9]|uniref:Uncharacterized protein n=1 Tax=Pseudobowmanella zhangzhouensis TaxID=1537679 RepID=A0ABW1XLW1_9ALTE|nr:hypothetical protein [Bowmanella sp. JS7-9]TBX21930.1 hypothetical protein TK45_10605 [Bowmanella sp. JS7-9]
MPLTTAGKNTALDALTITHMSLHTGDPSDTGAANEATGGSPAYARQVPTFGAASAGTRTLSASVTFDVPAGTFGWYALWNNTTCLDKGQLNSDKVLGEQGQIEITSGTVSLT